MLLHINIKSVRAKNEDNEYRQQVGKFVEGIIQQIQQEIFKFFWNRKLLLAPAGNNNLHMQLVCSPQIDHWFIY